MRNQVVSAEDHLARLLAQVAMPTETRSTCSPRYDEVVVGVTHHSDLLVTIVFRAKKRGLLRVVRIDHSEARWVVCSHDEIPIDPHARHRQPGQVTYPERDYLEPPTSGL
jgi:hypothetical protein